MRNMSSAAARGPGAEAWPTGAAQPGLPRRKGRRGTREPPAGPGSAAYAQGAGGRPPAHPPAFVRLRVTGADTGQRGSRIEARPLPGGPPGARGGRCPRPRKDPQCRPGERRGPGRGGAGVGGAGGRRGPAGTAPGAARSRGRGVSPR